MTENPTTPRERIENYLELCNSVPGDYTPPIEFQKDLRSVLAANAGYERIIAEQRREAVDEYKKTLAAELREREASGVLDHSYAMALESIADDLEDGTL